MLFFLQKILEFYKNLSAQLNKELHLDNTGKYKIFNLKHSVDTKSNFDITLVSQCSSNHIYLIDKLCDAWPVSILNK